MVFFGERWYHSFRAKWKSGYQKEEHSACQKKWLHGYVTKMNHSWSYSCCDDVQKWSDGQMSENGVDRGQIQAARGLVVDDKVSTRIEIELKGEQKIGEKMVGWRRINVRRGWVQCRGGREWGRYRMSHQNSENKKILNRCWINAGAPISRLFELDLCNLLTRATF